MNVSCPSCKTRYSVDDSRVPPSGVTIKCPKCGHTFVARRPEPSVDLNTVALPGSVASAPASSRSAVPLPGSRAPKSSRSNSDLDLGLDMPPPKPASGQAPRMDGIGDTGMLDFIDDAAEQTRPKPSSPAQTEFKVRHRNGRVEGPYGQGRISTMLRNKELQGSEDISEDGVSWRSITSDPQFNGIINELAVAEEQMSFGNVNLDVGGDLDLGLETDALPPPSAAPLHQMNNPSSGPRVTPSSAPAVPPAGNPMSPMAQEGIDDLDLDMPPPPDEEEPVGSGPSRPLDEPDELEVGDIPELPPIWQTYRKPIIIFTATMAAILIGVFTHLFTDYGAFGIPGLVSSFMKEEVPPTPIAPPPPPAKRADPKEIAGLIDQHCYECFRSVFATIAEANANPDNMLALAKARGFASLAYGTELFPLDELISAVEALNTIDLTQALGGNSSAANTEILKARSTLEILTDSPDSAATQLQALLEQRNDDKELALLLGLAQSKMGKPKNALQALDKALVSSPDYAPVLHAIGEIVAKMSYPNRLEEAAQWFEKALDAEPSHTRSGVRAAELYSELHQYGRRRRVLAKAADQATRGLAVEARAPFLYTASKAFDDIGQPLAALKFATEAARLAPANSQYVALAAVATALQKDEQDPTKYPNQAIIMLDPLLKRNANDLEALIGRARCQMQTEAIDKGFIDLETAKNVAPRDFRVSLWEARFNMQLGKLSDARKSLARSIKLAKKDPLPNIVLGRIDLTLGDVDAAFQQARVAVEKDAHSAIAHAFLGLCYFRRGQLNKALETFKTARNLDDELLEAKLGYANTLRDIGARANRPQRSRELAESLPLYLSMLDDHPKNPQVLFEYGRALELLGDVNTAIDLYREASAFDERDPRPHLKMVAAYLEQAPPDVANAKKSLKRARNIEMTSGLQNANVRYWEARVALDDNRVHDAVSSMRLAVEAEPRNAIYQFWLGKALERNNTLLEAIACYEKAIKLNSRLAEALRARGWAALERHQFKKARKYFDRYREAAPGDRSIWVDYGESFTRQNRDKDAMKAFQTAIRYEPKNVQALVQVGNILSRRGQDSEAVRFFERAIEADPNAGEAWCQLGIANARKKLRPEVREALERCLQSNNAPNDMKQTAQEIIETARN